MPAEAIKVVTREPRKARVEVNAVPEVLGARVLRRQETSLHDALLALVIRGVKCDDGSKVALPLPGTECCQTRQHHDLCVARVQFRAVAQRRPPLLSQAFAPTIAHGLVGPVQAQFVPPAAVVELHHRLHHFTYRVLQQRTAQRAKRTSCTGRRNTHGRTCRRTCQHHELGEGTRKGLVLPYRARVCASGAEHGTY